MDFYTNAMFQVQKGCGVESRDTKSKFLGPPNNFRTQTAIRLKFGTQTEDMPLLRTNHKT